MIGRFFNRLTPLLVLLAIIIAVAGFVAEHGTPTGAGQIFVDALADYYVDLSAGLFVLAVFERILY
jgi:hypothetical protein